MGLTGDTEENGSLGVRNLLKEVLTDRHVVTQQGLC